LEANIDIDLEVFPVASIARSWADDRLSGLESVFSSLPSPALKSDVLQSHGLRQNSRAAAKKYSINNQVGAGQFYEFKMNAKPDRPGRQ